MQKNMIQLYWNFVIYVLYSYMLCDGRWRWTRQNVYELNFKNIRLSGSGCHLKFLNLQKQIAIISQRARGEDFVITSWLSALYALLIVRTNVILYFKPLCNFYQTSYICNATGIKLLNYCWSSNNHFFLVLYSILLFYRCLANILKEKSIEQHMNENQLCLFSTSTVLTASGFNFHFFLSYRFVKDVIYVKSLWCRWDKMNNFSTVIPVFFLDSCII